MAELTFKVTPNMISRSAYMNTDSIIDKSVYHSFLKMKSDTTPGYNDMSQYVNSTILNLLNSAINKNPYSLRILTDKDYLSSLLKSIVENKIILERSYVTKFNRIYRAYVLDPERNVIFNRESADILYDIAYNINKKTVDDIESVGIERDFAVSIAINRFSSTEERRNIRRTVRVMQHIDQNIMTEQMVINIFTKLFSDQLTNLFCAIMTDKFEKFDDYNEEFVYSTVGNALLDILNTMPIDDIKDILLEYINELDRSGVVGRFRLNSINPDDYGNITSAISDIENMGIYVY